MVDRLIRRADVLKLRDETARILTDHDVAVRGQRIEIIANIKPRMERLRRRENAGVIPTYKP